MRPTLWQLHGSSVKCQLLQARRRHRHVAYPTPFCLCTLNWAVKGLYLFWSNGRSARSREAALVAVLCSRAVPSRPGETAERQCARLLAGACTPPGQAPRHCSESLFNKGGDGRDQGAMRTWVSACTTDKGLRDSVETLFGLYSNSGVRRAPLRCSLPQFPCKEYLNLLQMNFRIILCFKEYL